MIVIQPLGKCLRLAQALQRRAKLSELGQNRPQLETDLEALFQRGLVRRQRFEDRQRLLVAGPGVPQRRPSGRLVAGPPEIVRCLLVHVATGGMMGKPFHVLIKAVRIELLHRLENAGVERATTIPEEACVSDLMSQRVLEGVLELGEEPRLVEELRRLQPCERRAKTVLRLLGDRLQQCERHILADHGRRLEQLLVFRSEAVDASGQDRLRRGRKLQGLDRAREPVGTAFPRESPRLDQGPHALLEEEGIALRTVDQESAEILKPSASPEQGLQQLRRTGQRQGVEPHLLVVGLVSPDMPVLRPVIHQQEQPRRRHALHQQVQPGLRLGVDPV